MKYLIDTNILLRICNRQDSQHQIIRDAISNLRMQKHQLYILPQNCAEFWNVATRPENKNGFGLTIEKTTKLLKLIERLFILVPDVPNIYSEWKAIVIKYNVKGVQVHDARLVAAMKVHEITHILTFNTNDFQRYLGENTTAINPKNLNF